MGKKRNGERLSKLVDRIWMTHCMKPLSPVIKKVHRKDVDTSLMKRFRSRQETLFERDWKHVKLGYFYELATAGLYGGLVKRELEVPYGDSVIEVYPDVLDENNELMFESKGCFSSESQNLEDDQIERYIAFQLSNSGYQLYYVIYRHSLKKIRTYQGSEEDLFEYLSKNTCCSFVLPFSVVLKLHETRDSELAWRYDGQFWTPNTSVKSRTINRFLEAPGVSGAEEVLKQLGLNPGDYVIERLMSPMSFYVQDHDVRPFPVLFVRDVNHESWIQTFLDSYSEVSFDFPVPDEDF
ncbi:hypothetical protein GF386_04970 [Candidatus Pacearchaeota archaeon]|nr:hypothetical protein [Candidatus Pacearchaeota archaeon]MBD3283465.1 hypothetical protein [Candidatus Pacearchaeota archaeon]